MSRLLLARAVSAQAFHRLASRSAIVALALGSAAPASAQLTQLGGKMEIPIVHHLGEAGGVPPADVRLKWSCDSIVPHKTLWTGMTVTRTATLAGQTVTYHDTLLAVLYDSLGKPVLDRFGKPVRDTVPRPVLDSTGKPVLDSTGKPVLSTGPRRVRDTIGRPVPDSFPAITGTVHVDKTNPSRLRVNPYLQTKSFAVPCGEKIMRAADVQSMDFYYDLENRQTLSFTRWSRTVGPVVVPVRVRSTYTADNDARVRGGTAGDLSAGVFVGGTLARVRYQYVEHVDPVITHSRSWSLGGFLTASKITVDSASTLSADTPIDRSIGAISLSPGAAAFYNLYGIDVGVFVGLEWVMGEGDAKKWDHHKRPWYGFGLAYQLPK